VATIKPLRLIQLGKEVTKGTPVAATKRMLAEGEITADYPIFRNEHPFGVMIQSAGVSAALKKEVQARIRSVGVSYEGLPVLLSLGIDQPVTAGAGPFTHTFDPGTAAAWNPHACTMEAQYSDGTNNEAIEVEYVSAQRIRLRGEARGALECEAEVVGRQVTDAAVTSLTLPTNTPIVNAVCKAYLNSTFALADLDVPAAGQVTDWLSFDLEINCGQEPLHTLDGLPYFRSLEETLKDFTLKLTAILDPTATAGGTGAERTLAAAFTMRFVTLSWTGPGNNKFRIVLAGKHEMGDFITVGEQDGYDVCEMTIVGHYDATGAKLIKAVATNDVATVF
jgi:hypothetical protein